MTDHTGENWEPRLRVRWDATDGIYRWTDDGRDQA
jgi:hypothetical protein